MLSREQIILNNKTFIKTYSDQEGYGVERDGTIYEEAIDPIEYKDTRQYVEVVLPEEVINEDIEEEIFEEEKVI